MREILESDWKILRALKPKALDRLCQRILDERQRAASTDCTSTHERYLLVYRAIESGDEEISEMFNDLKRSNATLRIGMMRTA